MASLPVSFASIISAITAPAEKTHPVAIFNQSRKVLNNPYMKLYLNKSRVGSIIYYMTHAIHP
jgi:hypothetical protein